MDCVFSENKIGREVFAINQRTMFLSLKFEVESTPTINYNGNSVNNKYTWNWLRITSDFMLQKREIRKIRMAMN